VLATGFYVLFACWLTWPLVTDLGHSIYGTAGDPYGSITFYRELVDHHHNPFLPGSVSQLAAPEGQLIPWARDLASAPSVLTFYGLTLAFGAIAAFGLYALIGYALTASATFLLARRLTGNTWASLIAGWALAFYPFAAVNGQLHLDAVYGWVLVLAVWRLIELLWRPTRRNGILAGLAVTFAMWWSPYFLLFVGVTYVAITATTVVFAWRQNRLREILFPLAVAAGIVGGFMVSLLLLSTLAHSEAVGVRAHSLQEITHYSAHPLAYILPDQQNPLFGSYTSGYLKGIRHGQTADENRLYVGVSLLVLAGATLILYRRKRIARRMGQVVIVLWVVVLAALITSMPPQPDILGVHIPLPSYFISRITTTWRVYERFVMIAMLGLTLLAAIGLDALTTGRRPALRIASMVLATVIVPLDLWAPQNNVVNKITVPHIYRVLARQPRGLVAEYPLGPVDDLYTDVFYQNVYGKPSINGYLEESPQQSRAGVLANIAYPSTMEHLAALGVKYVLIHETRWSSGGWPPIKKIGPGLSLITVEPYGALFRVTARPSGPALAVPTEGFLAFEEGEHEIWLLHEQSGSITIAGPCARCRGTLKITLAPINGRPRLVTLSEAGRVIGRVPLERAERISVLLDFSKQTTVKIVTSPGPEPFPERPSVRASIVISAINFVAAGKASGKR
jgi:hypothetical protein